MAWPPGAVTDLGFVRAQIQQQRQQRPERGRFRWPGIPADRTALLIDYRQFQWLLSGLSIEQRQALPLVSARVVG